MTRTHVEEGELVELQRKSLALFKLADDLADDIAEGLIEPPYRRLRQPDLDTADRLSEIAREVSDAVDALTDYVRERERTRPIQCRKWDCPE